MKVKSKNIIYVAAFALLVLGGVAYKFLLKGDHDGITVIKAEESGSSETSVTAAEPSVSETTLRHIKVYICGEVNAPGIYEVEEGTILNDVAMMAGGFTETAAMDHLNLVYEFMDNTSVYIPGEDNLDDGDAIIMRHNDNPLDVQDGSGASALVNINTASEAVLITLPGIGETTAQSIIQYRQERLFTKPEDIMNVAGIGEAKFQKIKDRICV